MVLLTHNTCYRKFLNGWCINAVIGTSLIMVQPLCVFMICESWNDLCASVVGQELWVCSTTLSIYSDAFRNGAGSAGKQPCKGYGSKELVNAILSWAGSMTTCPFSRAFHRIGRFLQCLKKSRGLGQSPIYIIFFFVRCWLSLSTRIRFCSSFCFRVRLCWSLMGSSVLCKASRRSLFSLRTWGESCTRA